MARQATKCPTSQAGAAAAPGGKLQAGQLQKVTDKRPGLAQHKGLTTGGDDRQHARQLRSIQNMIVESPQMQKLAQLSRVLNPANSRSRFKANTGVSTAQLFVKNCKNKEKISGFTKTNAFRELPEKARSYFQVLYNDPQYTYKFASRSEIIKYIQNDPGALTPKIKINARDESEGIDAHDKRGTSTIENLTAKTELHHHNWRNYFRMHASRALKKAKTKKAETKIVQIFQYYKSQAVMLDDSEVYYSTELDEGAVEEFRLAPNTIRAALEIMYETANETRKHRLLDTGVLSIPVFGPMSKSGIGSSAEITLAAGASFPQGSGAAPEHSANPYWYEQLNHRRSQNGGNQYIRGHLLNDHLGGPARPYNLIPLSSDANMEHYGAIEMKAKKAMVWMMKNRLEPLSPSKDDVKEIKYQVKVLQKGQGQRGWTKSFKDAPANFKKILSEMASKKSNPTVKEFKDFVKSAHSLEIYQDFFQMQMRAFGPLKDNDKVKNLLPLIQRNADLWEMEDKEVPGKVGYKLTIKKAVGQESYPGSFNNIVPNNAKLGYKP